ncbi:MAG: radical SAM protein [Eubacteriales bacterium]
MRVALHDSEKEHIKKKIFPNLALMKISTFHKARDDSVEWWQPMEDYDRVYSSKIFDFTPENPFLPKSTIKGGTGYRDIPLDQTLAPEIDDCFPDYTIYPNCDYAIGYLTRGCPNRCRWCVVPQKEGAIKPYRLWQDVVREDSMKLTLMDNNILACSHGLSQLEELTATKYKIDLNQGMDARLVTPEIAQLLSKLRWQRYIRFSCDQISQLDHIQKVVDMLGEFGVLPYRIFVYLLVTKDIENASFRVEELKKMGKLCVYAQSEQNASLGILPNKAQKEFSSRYMYSRCYLKETWEEYVQRKGLIFPEP